MKYSVKASVSPIYNIEPAIRESKAACLHNVVKTAVHEGVDAFEVRVQVTDNPETGGKDILCEAIWPDEFQVQKNIPPKVPLFISRMCGLFRKNPSM